MSLLIKGMSMPKSCKDCLCREYPKFSFESDWCCLNQKTISDVKVISPNCPLVNVPTPHGRLIDADCITKILQDTLDSYPNNYNDGKLIEKLVANACKQLIEHCPTIIEAEVSE